MAAAKSTKANTYVEKKHDTKNSQCFAITLLVQEFPYRTSTTKPVKPAVLEYLDDQFSDLEADGILGDWAVRAIKITPEQFKEGYESF